MSRGLVSIAAAAAIVMLGACATLPDDPEERAEAEAVNDPLEPTNRAVYDFNSALDKAVMEPVAEAYRENFPDWFRRAVHNFLANLEEPYIAGNDLLQGNPEAAADALGRFMINSTWGLFGTRDVVAETGGAKPHKTDIGVTFAVWGVPEGPYLMLPFFGPASTRDGAGRAADFFAHPTGHVLGAYGLEAAGYAQTGASVLDSRTEYLDPIKEIRRTSLDEYATFRSLFRQNREATINAALAGHKRPAAEVPSTAVPAASGATPAAAPAIPAPAGAGQPGDPDAPSSAVEFIDQKK
ncbi:hypothetical protein A6A04_00160 [Paramagnetospirillum marisnigri]|uniref:Surface lipoprotein n=1 Tax=Paramagnetospirillum marisnigri TaxID=1285242 RepID=A0A178MS14_9PROT|nr:VacJ family lipoprotein [Paramagnetospirillum marisnigri]OAN52160.1 hypothetical protein A6A04_00160 [Paramagnetospirillum marisnigri]